MTDVFTPEKRSEVMRAIKSSGTTPERRLLAALEALGYRPEIGGSGVLGRPDLLWRSRRVAVFVDGDFWHGNTAYHLRPDVDEFWVNKIERNMERDAEVTAGLLVDGWSVVRVWESAVMRDPECCAAHVAFAYEEAR